MPPGSAAVRASLSRFVSETMTHIVGARARSKRDACTTSAFSSALSGGGRSRLSGGPSSWVLDPYLMLDVPNVRRFGRGGVGVWGWLPPPGESG